MKKEALELVRKLFHDLKWEIPYNNLEDIFNGAKSAAKIFAKQMAEETAHNIIQYLCQLYDIEPQLPIEVEALINSTWAKEERESMENYKI